MLAEGREGEALADVFLVLGVNVLFFADVDDHGHAGSGIGQHGLKLRFAQLGPVGVNGLRRFGHVVGQLHHVEGEVDAEFLAPMVDHRGHLLAIELGVAGVGFALIPDRAGDAVGDEGGDHAVVENTGRHGSAAARRSRSGLAFFLGLGGVFAIFLLGRLVAILLSFPGGVNLLHVFIRFDGFLGLPELDGGAAPGGVDQADGNV